MKKILLLVLLLIKLQMILYGSPDYFNYHKKIINAEELFLKDSIPASLVAYKNIFIEYKPFAKDAFIALELACMIKDTSYASFFFEECFKAGINWDVFEKVLHIKILLEQNVAYKNRLEKIYWKERKEHFASLNLDLRKYLTRLSKNDDTAKRPVHRSIKEYFDWLEKQNDSFHIDYEKKLEQHPSLVRYRQTKKDSTSNIYLTLIRLLKKSYLPFDKYDTIYVRVLEKNILSLDSISKMLGYVPGEKTIGIGDNDYDYNHYGNNVSFSFVPVVIHLFYHHGCGFWKMKEELYESVKKGEIHPRYYALMYDYSYCDLKDKSYDLSMMNDQSLYKIKCPLPEKDKTYKIATINCMEEKADPVLVNKCRKELSISSLQHDERKKAFAKRHHLILFFGLLDVEM